MQIVPKLKYFNLNNEQNKIQSLKFDIVQVKMNQISTFRTFFDLTVRFEQSKKVF